MNRILATLLISALLAACMQAPDTSAQTADHAQAPAAQDADAEPTSSPDAPPTTPTGSSASTATASPAATSASAGAGTWRYADGAQQSASITSTSGDATLTFRNDPTWGRSAYLELSTGDFDCPTGCEAQVSIDGAAPTTVTASRPQTPQPRLSLRQPESLWKSLQGANALVIEYPAAGGATGRAQFEVAGADAGKLPGWN